MTEKTKSTGRIYKVTTPAGLRLVEANTKSQSIRHCVAGDYSAEVVTSSELYSMMKQGVKVEQAAAEDEKKSAGEQKPLNASTQPAASTPVQSASPVAAATPTAPLPQTTLQPTTTQAAPVPEVSHTAPAPVAPGGVFGKVQQHLPPQTTPGVHPVLAEQQAINPQAAAAAGAPPVNWTPPANAPTAAAAVTTPPLAPAPTYQGGVDWEKREQQA